MYPFELDHFKNMLFKVLKKRNISITAATGSETLPLNMRFKNSVKTERKLSTPHL